MNVLIYHDHRYGPAVAFTLPTLVGVVPEHAGIPGGPFHRAHAAVAEKGRDLTWAQWADQ